jgi:predicted nucleotidyltransferase
VKLLLDNLPRALAGQKTVMGECLEAMYQAVPYVAVYLFGSYARGEARADSDIDLCIVSREAAQQLETAARWRRAMRPIWPRPSFTLVPITPARLAEKTARQDHFFGTVLKEGVVLAQD